MNEQINNFDVHSMIDSSLCLSMNHAQSIDSLSIDWQIWMMRVMIMVTKWWEWFHSSFSFSFTYLWFANRTFFQRFEFICNQTKWWKNVSKWWLQLLVLLVWLQLKNEENELFVCSEWQHFSRFVVRRSGFFETRSRREQTEEWMRQKE